MSRLPSLIVFGSLASCLPRQSLRRLCDYPDGDRSINLLVAMLPNLAGLWKCLVQNDPELIDLPGEEAVDELSGVFINQDTSARHLDKYNMIAMPATVLMQVAQYIRYFKNSSLTLDQQAILRAVGVSGGVQGLCAGLLTALAIAHAPTEADIVAAATTSIKLAFCIGVYIDIDSLRQSAHTAFTSLAVRWKDSRSLEDIENELKVCEPWTYISIVRDVRDITITLPSTSHREIKARFSSKGMTFIDIGLSGRYHTPIHEGIVDRILYACREHLDPWPQNHQLVRNNADGHLLPRGDTIRSALRSILVERANWLQTVVQSAIRIPSGPDSVILSFGPESTPQSIVKAYTVVRVRHNPEAPKSDSSRDKAGVQISHPNSAVDYSYPKHAVAVIGMSCNFPGAESIDEFRRLLSAGRSVVGQIPKDRFDTARLSRGSRDLKFLGNFIQNADAFDHKFFGKSSREAASTDPQQRLLLQATYQALESSGYFNDVSRPRDIGCYVGACATDYDANVGSHPASAYATVGTLRAFMSGKISHFFGWSGPSLTFDTACSSSAVAIHTACTAIQMGECSQAVAGGVALFTSPYLYENLAAAHFLSPTGQCKPFDAAADGYCRGEGIGLVILKSLVNAIADGDNVLGVIGASAINQNANCVPITVPVSDSQSTLYRHVAQKAGIKPETVTFVEAHGTGTPVGDPVEIESIRNVFGGPERARPLFVSSVKGNIGHLEGASGVAGLIKVLLQMQERTVFAQASFKNLNPAIRPLTPDKLMIPMSNQPLTDSPISAFINNYGAAGSNAAIVILEAPKKKRRDIHSDAGPLLVKYPVQITAASINSLLKGVLALSASCGRLSAHSQEKQTQIWRGLAYSLSRQQNQGLSQKFTASCKSIRELSSLLSDPTIHKNIKQRPKAPSAVLCFGGQVGQVIGLNKRFWHQCRLFRLHMDKCDRILRLLGSPGLYPYVFQPEPILDVAILQPAVTCVQIACAQSWIDSGLSVDGLVGHSLGQYAALCVSGILSPEDSLKLVYGRAVLMKEYWGQEPGAMVAVEAERAVIGGLCSRLTDSDASLSYEIACNNGQTSQVIVSDGISADRLEKELKRQSIRHKRLGVSHGFHSRFTEPLMPGLLDLARQLSIRPAQIPIETCTEHESWLAATPQLLAEHTRETVFFRAAIERLSGRLNDCTFLEVGSASSIVSMARSALRMSRKTHSFLPMDLSTEDSLEKLVDTTLALWDRGHGVQFWSFHRSQVTDYDVLALPPYVFEESRHWLKLETVELQGSQSQATSGALEVPKLLRLTANGKDDFTFEISPHCEEFKALVLGNQIHGRGVCPTSLYLEIATRALIQISEGTMDKIVSVRDLQIVHSLGCDVDRSIELHLRREGQSWRFNINSTSRGDKRSNDDTLRRHASGIIAKSALDSVIEKDLARFEMLADRPRFKAILDDPDSILIRGAMVYKVLSQTVEYEDFYRNLKVLASSDQRIFGKVSVSGNIPQCLQQSEVRPHLLESFFQVAILHAHCLNKTRDDRVFALAGFDRIQFGASSRSIRETATWEVLSFRSVSVADGPIYDFFVYDALSKRLIIYCLGLRFASTEVASPSGNPGEAHAKGLATDQAQGNGECRLPNPVERSHDVPLNETVIKADPNPAQRRSTTPDVKKLIFDDIAGILEEIADVPANEITGGATFSDMGVDSLMMIEVVGQISKSFGIDLPLHDLMRLTDLDSLVSYLRGRGVRAQDECSSADSDNLLKVSDSKEEKADDDTVSHSVPLTGSYSASASAPSPATFGDGDHIEDSVQGEQDISDPNLGDVQAIFDGLRLTMEDYCQQSGFSNFWTNVYPSQARLVEAYIRDAFRDLGCDLCALAPSEPLPAIPVQPQYLPLLERMCKILADGGLIIAGPGRTFRRTSKPLTTAVTPSLYQTMLDRFPLHKAETQLLDVTGSQLSQCLTGAVNPLELLFSQKAHRQLLADVYAHAPMCKATSLLLADFLERALLTQQRPGRPIRILEVGGGTGGTARHLIERLTRAGVRFEYTFTDISSSLVAAAKRTFSAEGLDTNVRFRAWDCSAERPKDMHGVFDIVVATNVLHAVHDAGAAVANVAATLLAGGMFCLVEFTAGLYWFDLVYGLLEGWWVFGDGRHHALADAWFWDTWMRRAGLSHVAWTSGSTLEAQTMRLICGFMEEVKDDAFTPKRPSTFKRAGMAVQELVWKTEGTLELKADVYFPKTEDSFGRMRPIALMVHGGGHLLFGRADVPMKHVRELLKRGYLPVSVDYRLCPEMSLFDGPITDCCDALQWVRDTLPSLALAGPHVKPDGSKILALGWSSGGGLAMTLGYMARLRGMQPPDAILPFYAPSDLEAEFWSKPIFPEAAQEAPQEIWGELDCVREEAIVAYTPMSNGAATGLSLTLNDDRAKLILHMNWTGQSVNVLVRGLPPLSKVAADDKTDWRKLPPPPAEDIRKCSPFWHITQGSYTTPTFMVHGNIDDWIPYQMTERTVAALRERGVPAGVLIPDQCGHAFDLFPVEDRLGHGWVAIEAAYDFAAKHIEPYA